MRRASVPIVLVAFACGGGTNAPPAPPPEPFIAFSSDFGNFRTWESFALTYSVPGNDHLSGPRTVFLRARPPAGAKAFPVGTMIVKESGDGDLPSRHVFAMVKRGGGFNADGAAGWEWFELQNVDDADVALIWRGLGPTNGDAYGSATTGGCNGCHSAGKVSDYVFSPPLAKLIE